MAWQGVTFLAVVIGVAALIYQYYANNNSYGPSQTGNSSHYRPHDTWDETSERPHPSLQQRPRRRRSRSQDDCIICWNKLGDEVRVLTCGHTYHISCIKKWVDISTSQVASCPICRQPIRTA